MTDQHQPRASIVLNGDDVYEDMFGAAELLSTMASTLGFATTVQIGTERLVTGESRPDLVVLYTATGRFPVATQQALADYVAAGTGLVAVHSACVLYGPDDRILFDLIGSRFATHGPLPHESTFDVRLVRQHPILDGISDFRLEHEHYVLQLADDRSDILAVRDTADGPQPLVYVRHHGAGRVAFVQFGHDLRCWADPHVRQITAQAMGWAGQLDGVASSAA